MFRANAVVPSSEVHAGDRQVTVSRRQGRRYATGARESTLDIRGLLTRVVEFVVSVVVLVIVAGILLVVLNANATNSIVSEVHSWARWLAGPFDGIFSFHSANAAIAVNWGIAAVVYLLVAGLIVWLLSGTYRNRTYRNGTYRGGTYPNQEVS
jgi:uncharacterized protein involved in cysteine biosynthesis